jgi:hypothetical protein
MKAALRLAALALLVSAAAPAAAQIIANPTQPGFKVTKVQLGIIPPDACPGVAKLAVWVFANQNGHASFLLVRRETGAVSGPYEVDVVAGSGGVHLGTYTRNVNITQSTYAEYRVVIPNSDVHSNWVSLIKDC